ncbi:hypothetical protein [Haliangium sp.]
MTRTRWLRGVRWRDFIELGHEVTHALLRLGRVRLGAMRLYVRTS